MESLPQPYHLEVLVRELCDRKRRNPRYSMRAFAQDLNLHPSALSRILANKQTLSLRACGHVLRRLELQGEAMDHFIASIAEERRERAVRFLSGVMTVRETPRASESLSEMMSH